jgi:hypothetical protein
MTDIVERLRKSSVYEAGSADPGNLGDEAADEIERLRAKVEKLETEVWRILGVADDRIAGMT